MAYDLQRASMWKRISAGLLDLILLVILSTGFLALLSLIDHYDRYQTAYENYLLSYEEKYNTSFDYTEEEVNALPSEGRARYDEAFKAFSSDSDVLYNYNMVLSLIVMNVTLAILFAYLILEFIVPLILKNGMTIGKKIFSLGVMRTDCVRITNLQVLVRFLLGKFTIETMIPVLLIIMFFFNIIDLLPVVIVIAGIFLLNLGIMIATRTNSCIHDVFAITVVVDFPSQMIFDTEADLIHYKEKRAAEKADSTAY